jgi:hypothetical protein
LLAHQVSQKFGQRLNVMRFRDALSVGEAEVLAVVSGRYYVLHYPENLN